MIRALRSTVIPLVIVSVLVLRSVPFGSQELRLGVLGLALLLAATVRLLAREGAPGPSDRRAPRLVRAPRSRRAVYTPVWSLSPPRATSVHREDGLTWRSTRTAS